MMWWLILIIEFKMINILKYWILAETLEHEFTGNEAFNSPLSEHKADLEAILQYMT